jgi:hypothetical protein
VAIQQDLPSSRDGVQTVNSNFWPIIVVPGIMGSRVKVAGQSEGEGIKTEKIWDPDDTWFLVGLILSSPDSRARKFDYKTTVGAPMVLPYKKEFQINPYIKLGWGGVSWEYYGKGIFALQKKFLSNGAIVYVFGYDWRQGNKANGKRLLDFIDSKVKPNHKYKPIVVTHSMGGLVTRAACCQGGEDKIAAVIHTFMPTHGTPGAYSTYKTGEKSFKLGMIVGDNHSEFSIVASGVLGMFQLMPNHIYPMVFGDAPWLVWDRRLEQHMKEGSYTVSDPWTIYEEEKGLLGLVNHEMLKADDVRFENGICATNTKLRLARILANIQESRTFHTTDVKDYCHPYTWILAGRKLDTDVQASLSFVQGLYRGEGIERNVKALVNRIEDDGDATVAFKSAWVLTKNKQNCRNQITIDDVVHADMFNDDKAIKVMVDFIKEVNVTIPFAARRW